MFLYAINCFLNILSYVLKDCWLFTSFSVLYVVTVLVACNCFFKRVTWLWFTHCLISNKGSVSLFCRPMSLIPLWWFHFQYPSREALHNEPVSVSVFWEVTVTVTHHCVFVEWHFEFAAQRRSFCSPSLIIRQGSESASPAACDLSAEVLIIYWRSHCVLFDLKQEWWGRRTCL